MMMNAESYREYAADCLRQAHGEDAPDGRNILLNVALAWLRLAQQTEAMDRETSDFDTIGPVQPAGESGLAGAQRDMLS